MRVVFFGTPALAVPSLESLCARHDVAAVVCPPDKPQGRSSKLVPPPVKVRAKSLGLPVHQPEKLNDGAFEAWLSGLRPELCAVAAYGRLLKQPILDVPALGWLNMHPSLLPKYRGASPIQTAILNGDAESGVTIMDVVLEMDAGDIILQERTPIGPDETAESLGARLGELGGRLLAEAADLVARGEARHTPQDPAQVTLTKLFEKCDGQLRWAEPAQAIHNRVRACVPWPVAHCLFGGAVYRIHETRVVEGHIEAAPGTVTEIGRDYLRVAAGTGQVDVLVLQAPGKRAMSAADFLRGHAIVPGDRFKDIT